MSSLRASSLAGTRSSQLELRKIRRQKVRLKPLLLILKLKEANQLLLPKRRQRKQHLRVKKSRKLLSRKRRRQLKRSVWPEKPKRLKLQHARLLKMALTETAHLKLWEVESITSILKTNPSGPSTTSGSYPSTSNTLNLAVKMTLRFCTCRCVLQQSSALWWLTHTSLTSVRFPLPSRRLKKY